MDTPPEQPRVAAHPRAVASRSRWRIGAIVVGGVLAAVLLVVAAFPWGLAKGMVERRLTARFGRPVTIASLDRLDGFGFSPVLAVRGLTIPQPSWAGSGDFIRLAEGRARLPLLPLLIGRVEPRDIVLHGLRLALVRRADGITNWSRPGSTGGGGVGSAMSGLTISDATLIYRDALRDRQAAVRVAADPAHGVRVAGSGSVAGNAVTLALTGPALDRKKPWPFTATIGGAALAMTARGTMDRPLDPDATTFDLTARADDLKLIDAVIEAGLIGTQRVDLAAHVRRDRGRWIVTALNGSVGGSRIAGEVTTEATGDRHRITGRLVASELAFEDFASSAGLAKAAAERASIGERLVPDLRINLAHLAHTDGRVDFRIDRLVSRSGSSPLRAMRGSLSLDHQVLVVAPFTLDLAQGAITGTARIVQDGQRVPTATFDLKLTGSSIPALAGGGGSVTGTVTARARLTGAGGSVREAVGNSDGRIGFVARDGILPAKLAAELGFNAGGAFVASDDDQAGLRCVVVPLTVRHGRGTIDPAMIVDTSQSQLTGHGTISFPSEAMAITVTGAPKHGAVLRLPGSATIGGTIREPQVTVAPGTKSIGNILKAIGRAITGRQEPVATNADCDALTRAALR